MSRPHAHTAVREFIRQQMCPICEKGPFKALPVHTCKKHGIDKWALRDMAGYTSSDRISSDEWVAEIRERMRGRVKDGEWVRPRRAGSGSGPRTKAGIEKNRRTIIQLNQSTPPAKRKERARAASAVAHSPEKRSRWKYNKHGTLSRYGRGCRCEQCRQAENSYRRELYRRKRNARQGGA